MVSRFMNFIPTKLGFDSGENSLLPWDFLPCFLHYLGEYLGGFLSNHPTNIAMEKHPSFVAGPTAFW